MDYCTGIARQRVFTAGVALIAVIAGGVAAAGLLYESGLRTEGLERFHLNWMISSDSLAERAYARLLAGDAASGLELFRLAVERDPASPYRWCDYAEARLAAGDREGARGCMKRGIALGPCIGPVLMRGVNFAFRTGDATGALEYGKRLLGLTKEYDTAVFTVWERMETPAGRVLEAGIPVRAAQAYHRYLMGRHATGEARASWDWLVRRGFADDRLADEYAGFLLRVHEPDEAVRAWAANGREPGYPGGNAVFNGGFERAPAGSVFDWRTDRVEGAVVEREEAAAEGAWALRLSFDQSRNVRYAHVSQRAVVQAGAWRFEGRMRTERITTDEGLGFRIYDADTPQRLDVQTERLTGTHGWTTLAARLTVSSPTRVLCVEVVREPSLKFDNKLGGTAWIDAISLRPIR